MKWIKNIFKIITDIGIDDNLNINDKFKIRFINGVHFLIALILSIGIICWIILDKKLYTYIELIYFFLAVLGLLMNKYKLFNCSAILFYLYCNFLIVYNVELYPKEAAGYVYYFPFAMITGINNLSVIKDKMSYTLLFISFLIFLLVVFVDFSAFIPKTIIVQFTESETYWVRNFNIAIAGLSVILFTCFYIWLSNNQTSEVKKLIHNEKKLHQQLITSLNQKEVLLSEVHHRVKNNLTMLNSIINMKINNHHNKNIDEVLTSLQNRIYNMSLIHNILYTHENIDNIDICDFIKRIIYSTIKQTDSKNIEVLENYDDIGNIKPGAMIPLGIIINEVVSNAVNHGLSQRNNLFLNINAYKHDDNIVINISDNGRGFDTFEKNGIGIELICTLVDQIGGKISFSNNNGLNIKIGIPQEEIVV